jgi:uncharacterized NAD-dependent epimerase/dehydratase family protein
MLDFSRSAILAEGKLGLLTSKTAACLVRYVPGKVSCIIDSTKRGRSIEDVLGFGGGIPIVGSLDEALVLEPDSLIMGIAPRGGALPDEWRQIVLDAITGGLNIISGLHTMLGEDPGILEAARKRGVEIWDIRRPPVPDGISQGLLRNKTGKVVLTVGSDCRTGKMTVAYELVRALESIGTAATFVPTGQTGILLGGWGVAVDRVPGDFMARVVEDMTLKALNKAGLAVVEGQGAISHPSYSGVALGIIHGCCPDGMILCHDSSRSEIPGFAAAIPSLGELIGMHEMIAAPVFRSRVIGIALATHGMSEAEAAARVAEAEEETGLPATDVIRWGCGKLIRSLQEGLL